MATGRIGVTPVLGTRWSKAPAGGTTSLSGLDDNSVSLVYSVGYEQVYRNGVLLSRGNDYTATSGTSITLTDATISGDIIEVFAQELLPLTDAISKGQFTAKGSILSASAASTPAVLAVGTNGQVLKADSSTTTGLAWGTDTSGAMTLISSTTFTSVASQTFDNVFTTTYDSYLVTFTGMYAATASDDFLVRPRYDVASPGDLSGTCYWNRMSMAASGTTVTGTNGSGVDMWTIALDTGTSAEPSGTNLWFNNVGNTANKGLVWGNYSYGGLGIHNWFCGDAASGAGNNKILTGFKVYTSSSNISGTVRIYGIAKS